MSTEANQLPDDVTLLKQMICEQAETIRQSRQRIDRLEHYLEQLLRSKYGPRSERLDPNQLQLFDQEDLDQEDDGSQTLDQHHDDPVVVREHRFPGERHWIQMLAAYAGLSMVRDACKIQ